MVLFAAVYRGWIAAGLTAEHLGRWADPLRLSVTALYGRAVFADNLFLDDWVACVGAVKRLSARSSR